MTHSWLARVPLFIPLCATTQAALDDALHLRTYDKGQPIFLEGHRPTGLCIVVTGLVREYRMMEDGRVHVHHYLRPYASLNMIGALDGRPTPVSAEAVIESQVGWLPRAILLDLMTRDTGSFWNSSFRRYLQDLKYNRNDVASFRKRFGRDSAQWEADFFNYVLRLRAPEN